MKKTAAALAILIGSLTLACSTLTTAVDYDHTVSFSQFHTFQLADGMKDPVTFTQKRIETAVTGALTAKGWQPVSTNPDILVYTHVTLSQQKQWTATSMGGGFGYRGWGGMGGTTQATETNIPIGTLVVDLVNPKTHELVWRGQASNQVSGNGEDQGKIDEAVTTLFQKFPPAPGQ